MIIHAYYKKQKWCKITLSGFLQFEAFGGSQTFTEIPFSQESVFPKPIKIKESKCKQSLLTILAWV